MKPYELLLIKEGPITQEDWKRIKKYTDAHIRRHTKLLVCSILQEATICFGNYVIPPLNFN